MSNTTLSIILIIALFVLWRVQLGGGKSIIIRLFCWGDALLKILILRSYTIDEWAPTSWDSTQSSVKGMYNHRGYCFVGIFHIQGMIGLVILNTFFGLWIDEDYFFENQKSAWSIDWFGR